MGENDNIWSNASRLFYSKVYAIVQSCSASVSFVASSVTLYLIYRSHLQLSTTSNRLLCGLCIADIISSLALALATMPIPADAVGPAIWNARGSTMTCDMAGMMTFLGTASAPLYNSSLCVYYLSIIKYKLSEEEIRNKVEVWLHLVSILFPLVGAIAIQLNESFNPMLTVCWVAPYPFGCDFDKDAECIRGEKYLVYFIVFSVLPLLVLPCVIVISMTMMYMSIRKLEKDVYRYSSAIWVDRIRDRRASDSRLSDAVVSALPTLSRLPSADDNNIEEGKNQKGQIEEEEEEEVKNCQEESSHRQNDPTQDTEETGTIPRRSNSLLSRSINTGLLSSARRLSWLPSLQSTRYDSDGILSADTTENRNRYNQQSRKILHKALAYSLSYFATYFFYIVIYVFAFVGKEPGFVLEVMFRIFTPLQGFYNFLVYIHQRVIDAKKSNGDATTWAGAFLIALKSRGPRSSRRTTTNTL